MDKLIIKPIVIEKNIEMPEKRRLTLKYPFTDMLVGDSFFIGEVDKIQVRKIQASIISSSYRHKPKKFILRTVEGGVRCWRIS